MVGGGDGVSHRRVSDLPDLLGPGDVVVVNDTRVMPARLRMRRATGATAEVLLLAERGDGVWEALVRPSRRLRDGEMLSLEPATEQRLTAESPTPQVSALASSEDSAGPLAAESQTHDQMREPVGASSANSQARVQIGEDLGEGRRLVRLHTDGQQVEHWLAQAGVVPLPPYITGDISDPKSYQTVYARRARSAAAPTAGLHFTESLLQRLRVGGVKVVALELEIGLDTFRPMTAERLSDHVMHTERYRIPEQTIAAVASARRVIAVGTTVARTLETHALTGESQGHTGLFIRRPFRWRSVDLLMTNFHLPRSSLLCMLDAFVGPRWRDLYNEALRRGYRFLSFGDAMLVERASDPASPP